MSAERDGLDKDTNDPTFSFKCSLFTLFHEIVKCYSNYYLKQAITYLILHIQLIYYFLQFSVLYISILVRYFVGRSRFLRDYPKNN